MKGFARAAVFGILMLGGVCASSGAADPPRTPRQGVEPVSVKGLDAGRVRLTRGTQKLVLNLGPDIAGCKSRLYDPMEHVSSDADVRLETVDETRQGAYTYLVLLAGAPPNCNIQGHCGAGGWDSTLIWLKLSRDLKLAGKQSLVLDDCRGDRSAVLETSVEVEEPASEVEEGFEYLKVKDLPWDGDILRVAYQVRDEKVQRFIYDRRNPDAGFQKVSP